MNELLEVALVAAGLLVTLTAFFTVMELLFPARIAGIRRVADAQPGRCLAMGAVNFFFFGMLALASFAASDALDLTFLALPGLVIGAALAVALAYGLAAVVQLVGERLLPTGSRPGRSIAGSLSLVLACGLPFVGWFALLPYIVLLGLGALVVSAADGFQGRK